MRVVGRRPRQVHGGALAALVVAACASLALGCSKSHLPSEEFTLVDPLGGAGQAGTGATVVGGTGWGGTGAPGASPGAGAGGGQAPFFNCGGFSMGACNGNILRVCHDDGTEELTPCAPGATCVNIGFGGKCFCGNGTIGDGFRCDDVNECTNGTARCSRASACVNRHGGYHCGACAPGFDDMAGDGSVCVDIDECAIGNGGCDARVSCFNTDGGHYCGQCPPGHLGFGNQLCTPGLIDLSVSPGQLSPYFSNGVSYYTVNLPVLTETIAIAATAAAPGIVSIDGQVVEPGSVWTSPWLTPGAITTFSIEVSSPDSVSLYTLAVWRDDRPQPLVSASVNDPSFGRRVATSGGEVVVAAPLADPGGRVHVYVSDDQYWYEEAWFTGDAVQAGDRFGSSIAISDSTIAVGAPSDDAVAADSGAVYVFERSHAGWAQQAYLKAANAGASDGFGHSVALFGETLVVGAPFEDGDGDAVPDSGAVYVFVREAAGWVQRAYLRAANAGGGDGFGAGVALHEGTLVVAAPLEDSASPGVNGNASDESALDSGAAYVFVGADGSWMQQAYLKASNPGGGSHPTNDPGDQFGGGESLAGRGVAVFGDTIAVGAAAEDSSALGVNGAQSNEGARDSGAVYVFVRSGTSWAQEAYLKAGHRAGAVNFGGSLALWQEQLVVGAPQAYGGGLGVTGDPDDGSVSLSGAAYVFERTAGAWTQRYYLKSATPSENDFFGHSVSVAHGVIVVGTGGPGAGAAAAYVFR